MRLRLLKNCCARELGYVAMAVAELESREGIHTLKSWKICMGEWKVFFCEARSKHKVVSWRSLWKMAWVAELLLISMPT